jgi:hypothetical protein
MKGKVFAPEPAQAAAEIVIFEACLRLTIQVYEWVVFVLEINRPLASDASHWSTPKFGMFWVRHSRRPMHDAVHLGFETVAKADVMMPSGVSGASSQKIASNVSRNHGLESPFR